MAETQRQTRLDCASAVKNPLFNQKRDLGFHDEGRLAIIGVAFGSYLGNVRSIYPLILSTRNAVGIIR